VSRVLGAAASLLVLTGCGGSNAQAGKEFYGPAQPLGAGSVRTYETVSADGQPTEVGVRMTTAAMDGLPTADLGPPVMLDFPAAAPGTAFTHVMLNWNPHGHEPPGLYGRPHFDFHFDLVEHAVLAAIRPSDPAFAVRAAHLPEPKYVPADYAPAPGPPPAMQAVPGMGLHLTDTTDKALIPGHYDFTQIFINGAWDGRYTFMEPMLTRAWLLTRPDLPQEPIKQPQAYQRAGYYPTTFAVHFDAGTNEYVVALGGLTMRTAS
jgi:hypothetical protein